MEEQKKHLGTGKKDQELIVLRGDFCDAAEQNPLKEKPLQILMEMEEALRGVLEDSYDVASIDKYMREHIGEDVDGFLGTLNCLRKELFEAIAGASTEQVLKELGVYYRALDRVIGEPMNINYPAGVGGGGGLDDAPTLDVNKIVLLLEVLQGLGVFVDDLSVVLGKNRPEMVRAESYIYVEIPRLNKTVLLNLAYGEATFVLDGIFEEDAVMGATKKEWVDMFKGEKIIFNEKHVNDWMKKMSEVLEGVQGSLGTKIEIKNYELSKKIKKALKKDYPRPEDFMGLTQRQRIKLRYFDRNLGAMATVVCGKAAMRPSKDKKDCALFAREVYGEGHEVIEQWLWDEKELKEKVVEVIKKDYPSPESFMDAIKKRSKDPLYYGRTMGELASVMCEQSYLSPIKSVSDRALFAREVYGSGYEVIEQWLWDEKELKKKIVERIKKDYPTPDGFMGLGDEDRGNLFYYGRGVAELASIASGTNNLKPANSKKDYARLARGVYGEGHEVIDQWFWDKEYLRGKIVEAILRDHPDPEEFMELYTGKYRKNMSYFGRGSGGVASIVCAKDICEKSSLQPANSKKDCALLAEAVYGEGHEVIEKILRVG